MICACNDCHSIFSSEKLPEQCPEFGKESIVRHVLGIEITEEAVREAYPYEQGWFYLAERGMIKK